MPSHRHQCPICQRMFICHADVIDNPDGMPTRLCAREDGGYGQPLIKPVCQDCKDEAEDE